MIQRIGRAELHLGDCREVLRGLAPCSVDALVTDPPYHLTQLGGDRGFMGKTWDGGDVAFRSETWAECLRILKPGGYLFAFGGSRTYHRLACAIEDAGFVLHPMFGWLSSQGFPKAVNVSKALDREAGAEREVIAIGKPVKRMIPGADQDATGSWIKDNGRTFTPETTAPATDVAREWSGYYYGRQSLSPSLEPCCMAQRPFEGRALDSIAKWGVGALDVDNNRTTGADQPLTFDRSPRSVSRENWRTGGSTNGRPSSTGRWPSQIAHDGSPAVMAEFAKDGEKTSGKDAVRRSPQVRNIYGAGDEPIGTPQSWFGDSGSIARYFTCCPWEEGEAPWLYEPKTSSEERAGCTHPTMKPVRLMEHLIKLCTREGDLVLDPFAGSGTTLLAAMRTKRRAIGIEVEAAHFDQALARLRGEKLERRPAAQHEPDLGPLFGADEPPPVASPAPSQAP
jgi:site-specific DNA-methyltransferase (adenine-specific)